MISRRGGGEFVDRREQINRTHAIVFDDDCTLGEGHLEPSREARISRSGCFEIADCATGEFERRDDGVFDFDIVQSGFRFRPDSRDVTKQPQQQVDGMYSLIHQCAAAVERPGSSPARALVILGRSVPTHGSRYKNWLSQITIVDCFLELDDVRSRAILKEHAEFYSRFLTCVDQSIGALSSYVDG